MDGSVRFEGSSFTNMMGMMNSPDEENKVVALTCIENVNYERNLVYIVMLIRHTSISEELWWKHAPKAYAYLLNLGYKAGAAVSFKSVFETLLKAKAPAEDLQFFCDIFADFLKKTMMDSGFDILERLELKIILKDGCDNGNEV